MRRLLFLLLFLSLSVGLATAGVTGTIYQNIPNAGNAADLANQSSSLPNATFTSPDIDYCSGVSTVSPVACTSGAYTPAGFLSNATIGAGVNGFNAAGTLNNSEIVISGSTFLNAGANTFAVGHDDGAVITFPSLGLTPVNAPGGTPPIVTTFTVTAPSAGMYGFTLEYAEGFGPPAELIWQINGAPVGGPTVPEPNSFLLLGTGVAGVVGMLRRKLIG